IQSVEGGPPRAMTPERLMIDAAGPGYNLVISPDGRFDLIGGAHMPCYVYPLSGGAPHLLPGILPNEQPIQWSPNGREVFVSSELSKFPCRISRLDLATGHRVPWTSVTPSDPAGVLGLSSIHITPDGRSYAYGLARRLSDLQLVDELK